MLSKLTYELRGWSTLIGVTAMFLGLCNIIIYNYRTIKERKAGWQFGVYTIVLVFSWIIAGLYFGGLASPAYQQMYIYIKAQCWSAQIGLLTFFFVSAAFRTFRAKNLQALVLLIFAFIPFIGLAPWGEQIWPGWPAFSSWILDNVAMAGSRAIVIAASVGLVVMITRIVLRYEKGGLVRG
ncbi:hypothetical protein DRO56_01315 [Candidatus Bathyarchaeota archaeon]|nr:MAG: hypothetical protein DRO56_01315 [Candidatus Bathyarchaeota archaeon]